MAQEVGAAYVTLLPSGKGFGKAVEGEMQGAYASAEKQGRSFFSRLGGIAKAAGALGATAIATIAGIALKGGISRALNIEDAQAKLKGLGNDTKTVSKIMENALAAVKGTAFGLDSAATIAASAVAAGIKPGKELEKYLRLTADAATIAGVSLDEMGAILNKTTATGKVYTDNLNQLADRGIPIFQWLAEEYGVTQEALAEMVAKGEVDAKTFRKVIEENIGGAALASGDTTRGAFANMGAALSRLGVAMLGDEGLGAAKTFFNEMIVIFDGLAERIGPGVQKVQEKLGGIFQIEGMGEGFLGFIDNLGTTLGPLVTELAKLSPLGILVRDVLVPSLGDLATTVGPALAGVLERVVPKILELVPPLAEFATKVLPPLIEQLGLLAEDTLPALEAVIGAILGRLKNVTLPILNLSADAVFGGDGLSWLWDDAALNRLTDRAKSGLYGPMIRDLFIFASDFDAGWVGFFTDMNNTMNDWNATMKSGWERFWNSFTGNVSTGVDTAIGDWNNFWSRFGANIASGVNTAMGQWNGFWARFGANISSGINTAIANWNSFWGRFAANTQTGINTAIGYIGSLPGRIGAVFAGAGSWLFNAGRNIIMGLINGVQSAVRGAANAAANAAASMLSAAKAALGIRSPSTKFRDEVGKMIGAGLIEGLDSMHPQVAASVNHLVQVPDLGITGLHASGTSGGSIVNNFNGPMHVTDENALAEALAAKQRRAYNMAGLGRLAVA